MGPPPSSCSLPSLFPVSPQDRLLSGLDFADSLPATLGRSYGGQFRAGKLLPAPGLSTVLDRQGSIRVARHPQGCGPFPHRDLAPRTSMGLPLAPTSPPQGRATDRSYLGRFCHRPEAGSQVDSGSKNHPRCCSKGLHSPRWHWHTRRHLWREKQMSIGPWKLGVPKG